MTAHDISGLGDRVPTEIVEGNTPDISECIQFDWYQYVWYFDPAVQFPEDAKRIGQWLGVAHDVGRPMCFWVLLRSCRVVARSIVQALTEDDLADPAMRVQIAELDAAICNTIGDTVQDNDMNPELLGLLPHVPNNFVS